METNIKTSLSALSEKIVKGRGNTIFTIFPYKLNDCWMFDDEERDIYRELFVSRADDLLELVCKGAEKCTAIFSAKIFPDHDLTLSLVKAYEDGSADYYCQELKHDLWLCSCLKSFLSPQPPMIYLKIKI